MVKGLFDRAGALVALVLLAPVLLLIAGLVRWHLGAPVLFRQWRAGRHGRPFRLFKFRSMREVCDPLGQPLSDGERLTAFGALLRRSSLDELPELINILRGEMSFVGPRPLLLSYLPLYSPEQSRRHWVRPGLSGWAQVNGRNGLSWERKFELDVWYVDHRNLGLDLRIIGLTLLLAVSGQGVSAAGEATMAPFRGRGPHPQG
ncbi:MAG: sugar transferase [Cyanobacteriota bacterium]|nr:sugar transferase [Cyanobacteriota bacterium]